jgi:hypothetical protein
MKVITILITAGLVFTASGQSTSTDNKNPDNNKKPEKKVTMAAESPVIPPDATPLPDGGFRYVDKDGKKWLYRNTPFGVMKAEERPYTPVVHRIEDDPLKSEDLGESVRFTLPTPFGPQIWTTKKSNLSAREKSIWDRDTKKASGGSSEASKPEAQKDAASKDAAARDDGAKSDNSDAKTRTAAKQDR